MDIVSFLHSFKRISFSLRGKIVVFRVKKQYPYLFFSFLFDFIKKQQELSSVFLDLDKILLEEAMAKITTVSFDRPFLYWLVCVDAASKKKSESLLHSMVSCTSTNSVVLCVPQATIIPKNADNIISIGIEDICNEKVFDLLITCFVPGIAKIERNRLIRLVCQEKTINIEKGCFLLRYVAVLGYDSSLLSMLPIELTSVSQSSLFLLSRYFFGRQAKNFFSLWSSLYKRYSPLFWTSFWSDQIWSAVNYAHLRHNGKMQQAKMISFRLPFSFLQRDWSDYVSGELIRAHQFITSADFHLKNGGYSFSLDLFFSKFFWREFALDELVE